MERASCNYNVMREKRRTIGIKNYINENKRRRLRECIIKGAGNYAHYLIDKDFLILCEDGEEYIVHFLKGDFKHLTGVTTDLSDIDFYKSSIKCTLDIGNINENQKYNWATLKSKVKRISYIHRILYDNIQDSLFLINLHTNTRDYPIAIKNTNIDACIGFVENNNARTLRKYGSSNDADSQKKILMILAKRRKESLYEEIVYLSMVEESYKVKEGILEIVSEKLQDRFLEILTKTGK